MIRRFQLHVVEGLVPGHHLVGGVIGGCGGQVAGEPLHLVEDLETVLGLLSGHEDGDMVHTGELVGRESVPARIRGTSRRECHEDHEDRRSGVPGGESRPRCRVGAGCLQWVAGLHWYPMER